MGKTRKYDPRDDDYGNRSYYYKKSDKFRDRRQKRLRKIVSKDSTINSQEDAYNDYPSETGGRI